MNINYKFINSFAKDMLDNKELLAFRRTIEPICSYMISIFYSAGDNPLTDEVTSSEIDKIIKDFFSGLSPELYANYLNIESFDREHLTYVSKNGEQENLDFLIERLKKCRENGEISEKVYQDLENYHTSAFKVKTEDSGLTSDGQVKMVVFDTTEDIFVCIHEMMHKIFWQNLDISDRGFAHEYLIEVNSITLELLLHDYLNLNNIHVEDAKRYKLNRFTGVLEMSYLFKFEGLLLLILENEGVITSKNIDKYISSCSEKERQEFEQYKLTYLEMIEKDGFQTFMLARYIFGLFGACYIKNKLKENKENVNLLYLIGKNIYESDPEDALKNCGLDFFTTTHGEIEFDIEKMNELGDAFASELVSLQDNRCK